MPATGNESSFTIPASSLIGMNGSTRVWKRTALLQSTITHDVRFLARRDHSLTHLSGLPPTSLKLHDRVSIFHNQREPGRAPSWIPATVVEIDGGQHNLESHHEGDRQRDRKLNDGGFLVLRFWNSEIDRNLSGVLDVIHATLRERNPHPAAEGGHPPPAGEG